MASLTEIKGGHCERSEAVFLILHNCLRLPHRYRDAQKRGNASPIGCALITTDDNTPQVEILHAEPGLVHSRFKLGDYRVERIVEYRVTHDDLGCALVEFSSEFLEAFFCNHFTVMCHEYQFFIFNNDY